MCELLLIEPYCYVCLHYQKANLNFSVKYDESLQSTEFIDSFPRFETKQTNFFKQNKTKFLALPNSAQLFKTEQTEFF